MLDKTTKTDILAFLTSTAQELVIAAAQENLGEAGAASGVRKIKVHADGSREVVKRSKNQGQAQKNSGLSKGQRKRRSIKTNKSKQKKYGKAQSNRTKKLIKRGKAKRAARGL